MKYLALDIGSSFIKYAILDMEYNCIRGKGKQPFPLSNVEKETRNEISAEILWRIVESRLENVLKQEGKLDGILLCTQMHGFVLTDEDGNAITPYVSWQDTRCTEYCDREKGERWIEVLEQLGCGRLMENAGVGLKPNLSMCNLYVLMNETELPAKKICFCTLGSYLIMKLTGNNVCHITNGAPTGLVDIVDGMWNQPLIEQIGADRLSFPKLATSMEICGACRRYGGEILVYPDLGDHQACVLGSLIRPGRDVNISMGTAGLLSMVTDNYDWKAGEVRPFFEGMYLNTLRGLCGGRDLETLVKFFADTVKAVTGKADLNRIWSVVSTPIAQPTDIGDCCQLDIQPGFHDGGSIKSITQSNFTFFNLLDAVYQRIALEYQEGLSKILTGGQQIEHIIYSGGAVRKNRRLMCCIADEVGCSWQEAPLEDEALLGLYRMALLISGRCESLEDTAAPSLEVAALQNG